MVPAAGAVGRTGDGIAGLRREHDEGRSLRITHDGEAQHAGNVSGGLPQLAAGFNNLLDVRVYVVDGDVADPRDVLGHLQHARHAHLAQVEGGVLHARRRWTHRACVQPTTSE